MVSSFRSMRKNEALIKKIAMRTSVMMRFFFCPDPTGKVAKTFPVTARHDSLGQRPINAGSLGLLSKCRSVDLEKSGRLEWRSRRGTHHGRDGVNLSTVCVSIVVRRRRGSWRC